MSPTRDALHASCEVDVGETRVRYDVRVRDGSQTHRFFYEVQGDVVPAPSGRLDFVVLALVFFAMRRGRDLFVDGAVSRHLLVNLEEFQRAWAMWAPKRLRPVRIACREEVDDRASGRRRAVVAFSGGVDATFALVRHALPGDERDRCDVVAAVLVHGFDVALDAHEAFAQARANARAMTQALGVPLSVVRTDWQALGGHWESEFGAALVSCLALFGSVADIALLGSDEDYASFVVPWGSNPITNPMLSSESLRVVTEGGAFSRTAKVERIAAAAGVAERLRVCWQGPQTGRNCGVCEKCLRTKLGFLAVGRPLPASLAGEPTVAQVLGLRAGNGVQIGYLRDIRAAARRSGKLPPALAAALEAAIAKSRLTIAARRVLRRAARR